MTALPRIAVSAPSSGHGKTAVAVGLLAAFAARGVAVAGFKVGPDHSDAAYFGLAAGRPGRNLDPRLVGARRIAPLFAHGAGGAELAVVKGTMGLFDSLAGRPERDSTAAVAAALRTPVVLVVDVSAMGQSVAALVHGFRSYDEMLWLGGVILNRVASDRHEELLRDALDDIGMPVFGALRRRDLPVALPSRQHGVVPVMHGGEEIRRAVQRLGESVAEAVDLDRLIALARSAPPLPTEAWSPAAALGEALGEAPPVAATAGRRPLVALTGGPSLTYSYPETAELLVAAGADVVTLDPLRDEALPPGIDALVAGGAFPESYAAELSANRRLCIAVAEFARSGRPVLAEGAALLWLGREFDGRPMCGVLDTAGVSTDRIVVGYREATAQASTPVAEFGARVVGYKQHCGVATPRAGRTPAWSWNGGGPEGFVWRRVHASQLILHWAGSPEIAARLVAAVPADATRPPVRPPAASETPDTPVPASVEGPAHPAPPTAGPPVVPAGAGPSAAGLASADSSVAVPAGADSSAAGPAVAGLAPANSSVADSSVAGSAGVGRASQRPAVHPSDVGSPDVPAGTAR